MIRQYEQYSTISNTYLEFFYSKLGPIDEYIIMRTGDSQYSMLVHRLPQGKIEQYDIIPNPGGYKGYHVNHNPNADWGYSIENELYVYSNIGYGTMEVLPCHEIMVCWGVTAMVSLVMLMLVFKGALFKCLRK